MNTYLLVLVLGAFVVLSYLYNVLSRFTRIPAVLLLLGTGIGLRYQFGSQVLDPMLLNKTVEILGIVGLIVIVLEASLDLQVSGEKIKRIRNSFLSALLVLLLSAFGIAAIIQYWLGEPFLKSIIYATPLSIISSAIIIPSVEHLSEQKREFIIYEASFSDILGILMFNYLTANEVFGFTSVLLFGLSIFWAMVLALVISFALTYVLSRIKTTVKFIPIFAILLILYALGKILHLPALLIILVFGMMVNNRERIPVLLFSKLVKARNFEEWINFDDLLKQLKSVTYESSFVVRTFFFILFGYSIDISILAEREVLIVGSTIVSILIAIRYVYLRYFLESHILPELFLMPRGLITVLLFYSIPPPLQLSSFNSGILFFVILTTSVLMMIGLMFHKADAVNLSDGGHQL